MGYAYPLITVVEVKLWRKFYHVLNMSHNLDVSCSEVMETTRINRRALLKYTNNRIHVNQKSDLPTPTVLLVAKLSINTWSGQN